MGKVAINIATGSLQEEEIIVGIDLGTTNSLIAIVRKDEKAIAANMADDFRMIDGYGNVSAKRSFVADIVDPKLSIDPYSVEEFDVRVYGDTALLSGRTHMTGSHDGKPFESNYRYIDIYVRRNGTWKIVSVQITKLAAAG